MVCKGSKNIFQIFPMAESDVSQSIPWNMNPLRNSEQSVLGPNKLGNLHTLAHSGRVYEVHEHIKGYDKSCSKETTPNLVSCSAPLLFDHTQWPAMSTFQENSGHWLKPLLSV